MDSQKQQNRRGDTGENDEKKEHQTKEGEGERRNNEDRPIRIIITSTEEQEPRTATYKRKKPDAIRLQVPKPIRKKPTKRTRKQDGEQAHNLVKKTEAHQQSRRKNTHRRRRTGRAQEKN